MHTLNVLFADLIDSNRKRDDYVDKGLDRHQDRINRHRHDLEALRRENHSLDDRMSVREAEADLQEERLNNMLDRLCHCGNREVPVVEGAGTADSPFELGSELEYAGSPNSYHSACLVPIDSAEADQPQVIIPSSAPVMVPSPSCFSDQENICPACCRLPTPMSSPLSPTGEQEDKGDRLAEEAEEQLAQESVRRQRCRKTRPFKLQTQHRMSLGNRGFHPYHITSEHGKR
jgi:hypothetical protein